MKNLSSSIQLMLAHDDYFMKISQQTGKSVATIRQGYRLLTTLLIACLQRQLQTTIGKGLVIRILGKYIRSRDREPDFNSLMSTDLLALATEGNYLFNMLIPGKKSAIVRIIGHYSKLSLTELDPIVGLCAHRLFTELALNIDQHEATQLLSDSELIELSPELSRTDFIAIGIYNWHPLPEVYASLPTAHL